jgi:hypothetical protein
MVESYPLPPVLISSFISPYDRHILEGQLDQIERLTGKVSKITFVVKSADTMR